MECFVYLFGRYVEHGACLLSLQTKSKIEVPKTARKKNDPLLLSVDVFDDFLTLVVNQSIYLELYIYVCMYIYTAVTKSG